MSGHEVGCGGQGPPDLAVQAASGSDQKPGRVQHPAGDVQLVLGTGGVAEAHGQAAPIAGNVDHLALWRPWPAHQRVEEIQPGAGEAAGVQQPVQVGVGLLVATHRQERCQTATPTSRVGGACPPTPGPVAPRNIPRRWPGSRLTSQRPTGRRRSASVAQGGEDEKTRRPRVGGGTRDFLHACASEPSISPPAAEVPAAQAAPAERLDPVEFRQDVRKLWEDHIFLLYDHQFNVGSLEGLTAWDETEVDQMPGDKPQAQ